MHGRLECKKKLKLCRRKFEKRLLCAFKRRHQTAIPMRVVRGSNAGYWSRWPHAFDRSGVRAGGSKATPLLALTSRWSIQDTSHRRNSCLLLSAQQSPFERAPTGKNEAQIRPGPKQKCLVWATRTGLPNINVAVIGQGPGVSEEDRTKLFQPSPNYRPNRPTRKRQLGWALRS